MEAAAPLGNPTPLAPAGPSPLVRFGGWLGFLGLASAILIFPRTLYQDFCAARNSALGVWSASFTILLTAAAQIFLTGLGLSLVAIGAFREDRRQRRLLFVFPMAVNFASVSAILLELTYWLQPEKWESLCRSLLRV